MNRRRSAGSLLLILLLGLVAAVSPTTASPPSQASLLDAVAEEDLEGVLWNRECLQGKVVLVEFWATWCVPCLGQLPGLKDAYERFHDSGFEILAVSLDRGDRRSVRGWLRRHEVPWPILHDGRGFSGDLPRRFAIEAVPRSILFDYAGRVIAQDLAPEALQAVLASLLRLDEEPLPHRSR